ncbi:aspartate/tyrosine/aromatic aminotransferase [Kocuria flava]|uniref:Aspartate/tyrosine/aromatic aminotransferase n=1 Tax=Kocuria flava TaxID=446860 RepID=A0A0U3H8G2_9MICC|nr:DinB family protein [Kocuria flava]ALU39189.1 aspartate/tyrosine/aromatic aminotransferase [Kocuria flava]GEO92113.1 hypothetical protein KFL01_14190 [Kocuria flava]
MTPQELLEDAARRPCEAADHVLEGVGAEALHARPGGANPVAWLLWHAARQEDAQVAALAGTEEVWTGQGWSARFGLDLPDADTGFGHGPEEVARVRVDSADLLRDYLGAVVERTAAYVRGLTAEDLDEVVDRSWDPPVTRGARLVSTLDDAAQHLGQAGYARGLAEEGWRGPW